MADTLFVTSEPLDAEAAAMLLEQPAVPTASLRLENQGDDRHLPQDWIRLSTADLVDIEQLRQEFLGFLDTWPETVRVSGCTFNELLTVDGRHSVWWTSVGADRQPTHGIYKYFRYAALVDRAIDEMCPRRILLFTRDPKVVGLVQSRAELSGLDLRLTPQCGPSAQESETVDARWLWHAVQQALMSAVGNVADAVRVRWRLRNAQLFQRGGGPTVVFASRFERYLELRDGEFTPLNWREIGAALGTVEPAMTPAYLPWKLDDVYDADEAGAPRRRGVDAIADLRAPLLIREQFVPIRGLGRSVVRQALAAWRFYRLAQGDRFRPAVRFARTDMSAVVLPDLKDAITRSADWWWRSAQVACALRAAGNVKAMVLSEEMYRPSMPLLAAASRLGIPTVGVQHGTLMPSHLMYRLPPGHVRHAPIPDYFAAYGDFAKRTLSERGAYPAERIWITGAARLDPLVNRPIERCVARARLKLPPDRRVVVLATQTHPWFSSAIHSVLEAMREHPDAVLCVKKHPSSRAMSIEAIGRLAVELDARDVRGFAGDIELLLAACDVWISASSTTILEATLAGKASICVNFSGVPDSYPYADEGASLPARSADQLRASLTRALAPRHDADYDRRRAAFLKIHAGPTVDGLAAATLARMIVGLSRRVNE